MTAPAPPSMGEWGPQAMVPQEPGDTKVALWGSRSKETSPHCHPSRRIITMMSPEDSWVSKWQRISE